MSWRTVVITKRAKLDLKTGFLVIRTEEDTRRVFLDELSVLIIENPMVSVTGCLITALSEKKIKVIICDEKRSPSCELVSYYGSHDCADRIRKQIKWNEDAKACVWTEIVTEKIRNQATFLEKIKKDKEAKLIKSYLSQIEIKDATNREGHAAKVYFNALFGLDFTRSMDCIINAALNYGYGIILSAFNREIVSHGYITQIGLYHNNMFNNFNLSCDLMEPFRVLVDKKVYFSGFNQFMSEEKHTMVGLLNDTVMINNTQQTVLNAVKIYCQSIFDAIEENDMSKIKFYSTGELGDI